MVLLNLKVLILSTLYTCVIVGILKTLSCEGKPATDNQGEATIQLQAQPVPVPMVSSHSFYPTISRRLLASRTDDNLWSAPAPARLPTFAQSGGNEHSRIRTKTDMDMTIGRDDDKKNQDSFNKQSSNRFHDAKANHPHTNNNSNSNMPRNHRRLSKWVKSSQDRDETAADEINHVDAMESVKDEGSLLYQSLKTMETHLLEADKPEDSLDNSSEKDIYLQATRVEDEQDQDQDSDEDININDGEDNNGHDPKSTSLLNDIDKNRKPTLTLIEGDVDSNNIPATNNKASMLSYKSQQLKHQHQQNTTPKGLTTWSAVQVSPSAGSGDGVPHRGSGSIQKIPTDYTISSSLAFSTASTTSRPITTADIVTKDKGPPTIMFDSMMMTTTMMPPIRVETGFISSSLSNTNTRVPIRPHNNNNNKIKPPIIPIRRKPVGIRKPPKYVKAPLDEVHATVIGSDETHDIYVVKTVTTVAADSDDAELKTSSTPDTDEPLTPPKWPYMTTTKRSAFSRIKTKTTARPIKNVYLKRTKIPILTLKTPITTTTTTPKPQTSTVYYRNPAPNLLLRLPISFTTNSMTFYDFIRTQIVPRIGLGIISLMATSPLILTLLGIGATVGRRKRRDLNGVVTSRSSSSSSSGKVNDEGENLNFGDNLPIELEELANQWEDDLANNFKSTAFSTHSQRQRTDEDDDEGPSTENYSPTSSRSGPPPPPTKRYRRLKKTKKTISQKISVTQEDEKPTTTAAAAAPTPTFLFNFHRNMNEPGKSPLRVYNVAAMIFQYLFPSFTEFLKRIRAGLRGII